MIPEKYMALSQHDRAYVTVEVLRRLGILDSLRTHRDLTPDEITQILPCDHSPGCEHYRSAEQ